MMGVYLRNKIYWYKRMIDGVAYYRSLKIKKGQESMLSARMDQIDEEITAEHFGLMAPISAGSITLAEFLEVYKKRKAGKGSLDRDIQRLNHAVELMGNKRLIAYGQDDFQKLEAKLLEDRRHSTVNRYFSVLHHLFSLAVKERALRSNPLDGHEYFIEDAKTGRALTDDEIKVLLQNLRKIRDDAQPGGIIKPILYDLVKFGLLTGARLSEILFLRHSQIENNLARLRISETKFRKRGRQPSQREKFIYLSESALVIIQTQPRTKDDYVFSIGRRDPRVISKAIYILRDKLGIPEFTFHWLRHTFTTRAVELADPSLVRELVGHSDMRTTLRYTHPGQAKKLDVTAKLGTKICSLDIKD
jgi:integrase